MTLTIETPAATATDLSTILSWYTGKALAAVRDDALPTLAAAERDQCWPPKASRRIHALLAKQAVAHKFARANERDGDTRRGGESGLLEDVCDDRAHYYQSEIRGWEVVHAMQFGVFLRAPRVLALLDQLWPHRQGDAEREALETARRWATDFAPLAAIVARLDATRPRTSYQFGEISQTVLGNVGQAMGLLFSTVRQPEIQWHKVEEIDQEGHLAISWWGEILWPPGTQHGRSKFADGDHCHACGHRIKVRNNWVPLVADSPTGPASLWVGRDCARHLFGCVVTGEGALRGSPGDTAAATKVENSP